MGLNISQAIELVSAHQDTNLKEKEPKDLYAPRNYIMSIGGKRMRSVFCLLGCTCCGGEAKDALDVAYAIELFHNFTLVHDDIMDEAELRRGKPAVHQAFSVNQAILTGDVMLIEVYDRLAKLSGVDIASVIARFSQIAREVCEGQSMDMSFETRDDVALPDYLRMIELKTAVLLGLALQLGANQAGATDSDQTHMYSFGVNAGIAFQLQDDYLDVYGDPSKFGKKVGGDIIQGKKTYLYLRALDLLHEQDHDDFKELYNSSDIAPQDKVLRVRNVFDELFLPTYCQEAKESFFGLAKSHLDVVQMSEQNKGDLLSFAETLMNREK